ncbi:MAG: hypothetical protein ACT4NJ_03540 [Nitrosopumilaceae archaeon]
MKTEKTEPVWFRKHQRRMTKWFIKQIFRFLYFLVFLLVIFGILGFLITHLSWERIIRFFLENGQAVTEKLLAFFNTTQGA